ncbi:peptidase G2 autoproteolytic cleavage domain-containing protein [Neobacillus sp. NPDC093127]|uniref:peptidase G2 autoproteolytic cleavage domain-containing protein n=1 Tax=Neobacillus sp. NPDC093127 TaxID=3364296 RepID=UPI003805F21E
MEDSAEGIMGNLNHCLNEVTIPAEIDEDGNTIMPEINELQPMLNPNWVSNREYQPRINRPEWVAVGLIGQILVRDRWYL